MFTSNFQMQKLSVAHNNHPGNVKNRNYMCHMKQMWSKPIQAETEK